MGDEDDAEGDPGEESDDVAGDGRESSRGVHGDLQSWLKLQLQSIRCAWQDAGNSLTCHLLQSRTLRICAMNPEPVGGVLGGTAVGASNGIPAGELPRETKRDQIVLSAYESCQRVIM